MKVFGDFVLVFGMIGILVGLVQMFVNMDDFVVIGFFMVVVFFIMFYGVLIFNIICLLFVDKLDVKFDVDEFNQILIIDGVCQICEFKSLVLIKEMFVVYLFEKVCVELVDVVQVEMKVGL